MPRCPCTLSNVFTQHSHANEPLKVAHHVHVLRHDWLTYVGKFQDSAACPTMQSSIFDDLLLLLCLWGLCMSVASLTILTLV